MYENQVLELGRKLKKIRKAKYMSASDLASKVGLSRQMISYWENGEREIKTKYLIKLAKILDIKVYDFFNETEEKNKGIRE